ncbi:carbonic anhydrase, partial [Bifidobacterium animalis]|nr:carbonic anhydrase [Bifidobacterium animalis]
MTYSTQETTANSTWSRMLAGNRRFAEGNAEHQWRDKETRESLIDTPNPD